MFIRESKTKNKKTGKVYIKHSLVESIRTERGPRQRVALTLGRLSVDREHWKKLATALEAFLSGKEDLMYLAGFELSEEVLSEIARTRAVARTHQSRLSGKMTTGSCAPAPIYQEVDVMSVQCSDTRTLGPELAAHQAWKLLEFDNLLGRCGFSPREQALAATVIWGRLIQPGSDLSTWQWLRERSSLSEFVEADISRVHKDQVYQIADKLLLHKDQLEEELYEQQCTLFSGRESLFLFDLTNFYFEGRCAENELAKRGKSKEKRQQNPLVSLALLVDQDGFPVKSKVYKGNVSEPMTLKEVLSGCGLLDSESLFRPTVAMDRGIVTKENIALLREYKFPFVVIERADRRHEYADEFDQVEGDAESIWRTYTTLTRVEAAFRSMKTDLGTRPVYHQGGKRTEAHLFLSILAYHMLINIEHRLKAAEENIRWHTLREHLASHQRSTVIWTNKEKETWSKRVSGAPSTDL
jgi:hypothetical protein